MGYVDLTSAVTAEESRQIIAIGIRLQFDALDYRDPFNYPREVKKLKATAFRYGLFELLEEIEDDK